MTQLASQPCFSIDAAGWCQQVRRVPSPHHNERAAPDDISLLVVHGISLPPGSLAVPLSTISLWDDSTLRLTPILPVSIS